MKTMIAVLGLLAGAVWATDGKDVVEIGVEPKPVRRAVPVPAGERQPAEPAAPPPKAPKPEPEAAAPQTGSAPLELKPSGPLMLEPSKPLEVRPVGTAEVQLTGDPKIALAGTAHILVAAAAPAPAPVAEVPIVSTPAAPARAEVSLASRGLDLRSQPEGESTFIRTLDQATGAMSKLYESFIKYQGIFTGVVGLFLALLAWLGFRSWRELRAEVRAEAFDHIQEGRQSMRDLATDLREQNARQVQQMHDLSTQLREHDAQRERHIERVLTMTQRSEVEARASADVVRAEVAGLARARARLEDLSRELLGQRAELDRLIGFFRASTQMPVQGTEQPPPAPRPPEEPSASPRDLEDAASELRRAFQQGEN